MKKEFIGKTLVLLGDSITQHGYYTYNLRSYFQGKEEKCYIYNRGTGGNRAVMAPYILDDEIRELKPDYIFISFGANDLGIWLYDGRKVVSDKLLEERKKRDDEYFNSYAKIIDELKLRGIKPIVVSPFATDELLFEKDDIETVADNDEKANNIDANFYTKKTYRNINQALKFYAQTLKALAQEKGALYVPMFEKTYEKMLVTRGLFNDDGLHYSHGEGHALLAKIFLEFLGCDDIPDTFAKTPENDQLEKLVQDERHAGFIMRASPYNPMFGEFTEEQIDEAAKKRIEDGIEWHRVVGECYFKYKGKMDELREEIKLRTEKL